jgi:hypothetical protein
MNKAKMLIGGLLLFGCGCSGMSHTDKGVIGGGLLGAGGGALIGAATGNPGLGAAIGAVGGAAVGGVTGAVADNAQAKGYAQGAADVQAAHAAGKRMGVGEVIYMTHQHVDENLIIQQIRSTGSTFNLTSQDVVLLKQNGVSDRVVHEMQSRSYQPVGAPPVVLAPAPVYREVTVIHGAPPPPRIHFGIGYHHHYRPHRHHCWH